MSFKDLDDFLVVEPIRLPIRGKVYEFPGTISARGWLLLQSISEALQSAENESGEVDTERVIMSDTTEAELRREMFGGVEAEMVEDNLTSAHIRTVFYTLIAYHLSGEEAAQAVWEQNVGKVQPRPNRAQRRASASKSKTKSVQRQD